ncbi:hypothetical protein BDV06DRAFT_223773 [Aspergillus oleicola]
MASPQFALSIDKHFSSYGSTPPRLTIALICALPIELTAVTAVLDEINPRLPSPLAAQCSQTLEELKGHNVVQACLPSGGYGTSSATATVSHLKSIFPNAHYGLMVGIGGRVPSESADI